MKTTRLSNKGHITIPHSIREARHWKPGDEFLVTDTNQGILLAPIKSLKKTVIQSVLGCTGYKGKKKSLKELKLAVRSILKQTVKAL